MGFAPESLATLRLNANQVEARHLRIKGSVIHAFERETAFHRAPVRKQRRKAVIFKSTARGDSRCLTNYAFAIHVAHFTITVNDRPVALAENYVLTTVIGNCHVVRKVISTAHRVTRFWNELWRHPNTDAVSDNFGTEIRGGCGGRGHGKKYRWLDRQIKLPPALLYLQRVAVQ